MVRTGKSSCLFTSASEEQGALAYPMVDIGSAATRSREDFKRSYRPPNPKSAVDIMKSARHHVEPLWEDLCSCSL
jgi:hypothetical protein